MKVNLLFILSGFHHGGTNKSLQNMLSLLDETNYNYHIFTTNKTDIYKNVFSKYDIIECPKILYKLCNSRCFIIRAIRYIDSLLNNIIYNSLIKHTIKNIERSYSINKVIAFEEGKPKQIAQFFNCTKIAWVHCDYALYNKLFVPNLEKELEIYSKFNDIICVSKYTAESFKKFFPYISNKVEYIYNPLDITTINILSNEYIEYNESFFKIVSIGRLVEVKQFEKIPHIVSQILKYGNCKKFKWFIIGDGNQNIKDFIDNEIKKYNLNNIVIRLGAKDNPYPYIKKSNLLVSTSSSEACPYVVNEAKILKTPVIVSNFGSSYELVNENNGIISSIEKMPLLLYKVINNIDGIYDKMQSNANNVTYDNDTILKQLNALFQKI